MDINEILRKKGMTKYRLSVLSGVPHATLNNICSGRSRIEKCSAETLYKLAQILHVTIEDLIIDSIKGVEPPQSTISFELFKSNICHRIKDSGDIAFIIETLKSNEIPQIARTSWTLPEDREERAPGHGGGRRPEPCPENFQKSRSEYSIEKGIE